VVLTSFTTLLLLYPVAPLGDFFLLETLPWDFRLSVLVSSVVDLHHFDADLDLTHHLMRMRILIFI
jgi:hypothetical protein